MCEYLGEKRSTCGDECMETKGTEIMGKWVIRTWEQLHVQEGDTKRVRKLKPLEIQKRK